jgi:flagellar hook-associated protein 3 FlgL
MSMRITNGMMVNSSLANIQVNKNQMNTLDTQLSTQKKINKPSEDPIVAIRALRLRSSLDKVTQYLDKNISDADSWLSVTEDALDEGYSVLTDLYNYCVQGSTDSYSSAERKTIAESLNNLRQAFYSEGDVDYAGRYVFTGFATDVPLTYQSDETAADVDYTITQKFTRESLTIKSAYTNAYTNADIINLDAKYDSNTGRLITPNVEAVHRLQLAYSDISVSEFKIVDYAGNEAQIEVDAQGNVTTNGSLLTGAGANVSITTTVDPNYVPAEDEISINTTTGELLLGENVYKDIYENNAFSFTYRKDNFIKGDLNPTMYFDCIDNISKIEYNKEQENIEYNINFSQKLKINTEASEAFDIYLGRNIDDLITAVQNVLDLEEQVTQVNSMLTQEQYSDSDSQLKLNDILEGLTKQLELAEDKMTAVYENGVGWMQGYQTTISECKADVGNRDTRLSLTKARLTEQKTNFKNLKSQNEDIDLEEVVVNYSAAELVYNASLTASARSVQQTLLDFL